MSRRILISPNAFKHSLSSVEVAETIYSTLNLLNKNTKYELAPIADGGDGTLDVFKFYFKKSKSIECNVHDPLGRSIKSNWLLLDNDTGLIELAKASGISLLNTSELNPMWTNTVGTGELILSALNNGCKKIIVALGGSATVDAGVGMIEALGAKVQDIKKHSVKPGGGFLSSIETINLSSLDKRLKNLKFEVLCDVKIPLTGEKGTVSKFSTQKGASEGEKIILEKGMKHYSKIVKETVHFDYENDLMVGSAGGTAFTLKSLMGAELFSGFSYLSNLISLEDKIKNSDLIITGEGSLDIQTILGKGVYEIVQIAKKHNKNTVVLCGSYDDTVNWKIHGIDNVIKIKPDNIDIDTALKKSKILLKEAIESNSSIFINN